MNNFKQFVILQESRTAWGAGVLPIAADTGNILIAFRSIYVKYPHTWATWGGTAEGGTPQQEALREFKEETRYTGSIKLTPAHISKRGFTYYNFIGVVPTEFTPVLNDETSTFDWVNYNKLANMDDKHWGLQELLKNSRGLILDTLKDLGH